MAEAAKRLRGVRPARRVAPFRLKLPKNEDLVIVPARDGALRVLKASRDAGVKRVVLTSSFAAVGYGRPSQPGPFDEKSWTPQGHDVSAYVKSKTLAERAAWDFSGEGGRGAPARRGESGGRLRARPRARSFGRPSSS